MEIEGRRVKRDRWIHTPKYVVAVQVEAIIPDADASEPCYEPVTVEFLREVEEHAKQGNEQWLQQHGRVYRVVDAA